MSPSLSLNVVLFGPLFTIAQSAFHGEAPLLPTLTVWLILSITIISSGIIGLANTGNSVAIERDWIITIAQGNGPFLTTLNTYMRRIDLTSKLVAPVRSK
jgi:solute carrier family 40 (iron-regulated transporter), member 1